MGFKAFSTLLQSKYGCCVQFQSGGSLSDCAKTTLQPLFPSLLVGIVAFHFQSEHTSPWCPWCVAENACSGGLSFRGHLQTLVTQRLNLNQI